MSVLSEWMKGIEELGKLQKEQDEETRKKFLDAPHNTIQISDDVKLGVWPGIDCVVVIPFYPGEKGKLNIHAIQYYELELVELMNYVRESFNKPSKESSTAFMQETILPLLRNNKRIIAIKQYRIFHKVSLKQAKEAVDEIMKENGLWEAYWENSNG